MCVLTIYPSKTRCEDRDDDGESRVDYDGCYDRLPLLPLLLLLSLIVYYYLTIVKVFVLLIITNNY